MAVALLPAAGASRRMGRPKLLLPFRGGTLVGSLVDTLRTAGVGRILLVTAPEDHGLRAWAEGAGVETAVNPNPERGMLSTIQTGVAALGGAAGMGGEILLVTPADLPAVRPETVSLLLRRMEETGAPMGLPIHQGKNGHPLAIAPGLIPEIGTLDSAVGLKQLRDRHAAAVLWLEVEDAGVIADVDTPEDYEQALTSG
jgi:molybdenum cofactor cytidylyltransferase